MGYRIDYGCAKENRGTSWLGLFTCLFFLLFCFLVKTFWPEGYAVFQHILLPGDPAATQQALEASVRQILWGEPLAEVVESFCITIIQHGS